MGIFNSTEPLGLPRGSVRALIALLLTVTFAYRFAAGYAVDPTLVAILSIVLTYYFVKRDKETDGVPVEAPLPDPVVGELPA